MPKTRLTAKLCSTPTQKSPVSSDSSPTACSAFAANQPSPLTPNVPKSSVADLPLSPSKPTSSKPPPPLSVKSVAARSLAARSPPKATSSAKLTEPEVLLQECIPVFDEHPSVNILPNTSCVDVALCKDACDSMSESESDLDDLPDVFSSANEARKSMPVKGDAVWVRHRSSNFWPCLVLQSNSKSRKLHVVFLDDTLINGQCIGEKVYLKYNRRKVLPYNHADRSKFQAQGKSLETLELRRRFQAALSKMDDYLTKRALGHMAACKAFFSESLSSEDEEEVDTRANTTAQPVLPVLQPCKLQSIPLKRKKKKEEEEVEKPRNCSFKQQAVVCSRRKKAMTPDERRAMRKEKNQPLVDFICSSEMKEHLAKIYRGERLSERHKQFMEGCKIKSNSSGPIDDDDQLETIVDFLGKCNQELTQQKLPNMDYLFLVMLPEAIIYAMAKIKRCGQKKAAELFEKGIKFTKSEHLEIHDQLLKR